jgi:hypothetical protein
MSPMIENIAGLAAAHFGGLEGFLASSAYGPTLLKIVKVMGPKYAGIADQLFKSQAAADAAATYAGQQPDVSNNGLAPPPKKQNALAGQ